MSSEANSNKARQIVAGDYILGRRLGSGGFGDVYEARHKDTQLPYAVKRITLSEEDAERFKKEALYPARIANQSMHVLTVHSFFQDREQGYFYLVTDLISQGDLRDFLDKNPKPLPLKLALEVAIGIARGLVAIHEQNIVHRDVKPRNILMDWKDVRWIPKIADFGLARSTESVSLGEFASAGYAAPEQLDLSGERGPGPDSDLFSFGMILYELLTGERSNSTTNIREYARWLIEKKPPPPPSSVRLYLAPWPDLDFLCAELLEFDRDLRKTSAGEVIWTLSRILREVEREGTESVPTFEEGEAAVDQPSDRKVTTGNRSGSSRPPIQSQPISAPRPIATAPPPVVEFVHRDRKKWVQAAIAIGCAAAVLLLIYILKPKSVIPPSVAVSPDKVAEILTVDNGTLPSPAVAANPPPAPPVKTAATAAMGKISFEAIVPIEVLDEDGRKLGVAPLKGLELPEGSHKLTFVYKPDSAGLQPHRREEKYTVVSGKSLTADANFYTTLTLAARGNYSTVTLINDKIHPRLIGDTNLTDQKLPIGGILEFSKSQGPPERRVINGYEKDNKIIVDNLGE